MPTRKRVLIADDDPAIRNLIRTLLVRNDFEVREARDGAEAIELLSSESFDAIVLDLMMPRKSGYEVVEFLKRNSRPECSIVVVTAAGPLASVELDTSRLAAIVTKPFDLYELVRIVRRSIEERSPTAAAKEA